MEGQFDDAPEKAGKQEQGTSTKREAFDRLSGIVDTDEARFETLKQENFKNCEQSVASLCKSINNNVDSFYDGNMKVYRSILQSATDFRDDYVPQVSEHDFSTSHVQDAVAPYIFQSFPVTNLKVDMEFTDDAKMRLLAQKVKECAPLALWHEPVDITNNGPEFFAGLKDLILGTARKYDGKSKDRAGLVKLQSSAIEVLFGLGILTGNHDLIISALDTIHEYEKILGDDPIVADVFQMCSVSLKSYLKQMKTVADQQEPMRHCMRGANVCGVFGVAHQFTQNGMNDKNSSITCDDTYLYLYVSVQGRSFMMKIGTGENGSHAGRVYLKVDTNDASEVTWVYCKGKLYSRKTSDPFGVLSVHDPKTLAIEGQVKLNINDCFQNPKLMEGINRNYPLLSDGESLYIVTVQVVQKSKRPRDELKTEFDLLQNKMKLDAKKAAEKPIEPVKEAPAKDPAQEKDEIAKRKQEERAKLEALKREKEERKKKKGAEKKEPAKKEEAPKAQTNSTSDLKPYKEIDIYRVCEFTVHQFDVQPKSNASSNEAFQNMHDHELFAEPLCLELYQAFSGLFSIKDCQRALKLNNDDIEVSVQWMLEEKSKPDRENHLAVKKSQVIYESLVQVYNQISNTNVDVQVVNSALLQPHHVTTGKWTLSDGQVAFHNTGQDNEVISVFSLQPEHFKQHNKETMLTTFQIPANLLEKNDFTQHYYDGKEWKCYTMQQICETIVKIKSLKDLTKSDSPKAESSNSLYTPEGFLSELQLYEPIKLFGTLLQHTNANQRNSTLHQHPSYMTFSPYDKNFYLMLLNSNSKSLLIFKVISELLPKREQLPAEKDCHTFADFVQYACDWLVAINEKRLQMPWRWRHWSHLYSSVIDHIENQRPEVQANNKINLNPLSGLPDSTPEKNDDSKSTEVLDAKKVQLKKLRKRHAKITSLELQAELEELGLQTLGEKEAKEYLAKAEKQKQERVAKLEKQLNKGPVTVNMPAQPVPTLTKNKIPQQELDRARAYGGGGGFGLFGDGGKKPFPEPGKPGYCEFCDSFEPGAFQCKNCGRIIKQLAPPDFSKPWPGTNQAIPQPQAVQQNSAFQLPRESICIARENKKVYAFCPTGSVNALESVFSLAKTFKDSKEVLQAMLDQVAFADNLSAYHNPELLDLIYTHFVEQLKADCPEDTGQFIWRILVVGWHLFVRTQQQQLQLLLIAVDQSRKLNAFSKAPTSVIECLTRVTLKVAPIALFAARFLHHASFYPLEFLTRSKVSAQIVTVQKDLVYIPTQKAGELQEAATDEDQHQYFAIKPGYSRDYDCSSNFKTLTRLKQSVTQMPLEILVLRSAKNSSSGLFSDNNRNDQFTFKTQSYFSLPVMTTLMAELCQANFLSDCTSTDLDELISFYTTQQPTGTHKEKFDFFTHVRHENAGMQDQLFKAFATAILQSMPDYDEQAQLDFAWDEDVSEVLFKTFAHLIIQALLAYSWNQPFNTTLMIKAIKFIEEGVLLLSKKTMGFTKKFGVHHAKWLGNMHLFAQKIVYMLHSSLQSQTQTNLAVKVLPSLLNILEHFRKTFNVPDKQGQKTEFNMLDVNTTTNTEGVDPTCEIVWETAHPYPKQELRMTENIKVPRAIGYFVEFDPRCCTQNGPNDQLQLKSQEVEFRLTEQVGTRFRSNGKHPPGQNVFILIGKQLEIEFRVQMPRQDRRRPGEPVQQNQSPDQRWGFRLTIYPIFSMPIIQIDSSVVKKNMQSVMNRFDVDVLKQLNQFNWMQFYTNTVYITSVLTQSLCNKNLLAQAAINDEISWDDTKDVKRVDHSKEAIAISNIKQTEVLNWHLLKGGLNLSCARTNANADMDSFLQECLSNLNALNPCTRQLTQHLAAISDASSQKKQPTQEQVKKMPVLQKKQTSFRLEQLDDFIPNRDSWTLEVKELVSEYETEGCQLDRVLKKIRQFKYKNYDQSYNAQTLRPGFRPFIPLWKSVERLLIAAMLYHSDSLGDIKKFLENDDAGEASKEQAFLKEQFTTIGRQLNVVLLWMLSRLNGQKELFFIVEWILAKAQEIITSTLLEQQRVEKELKHMADEDSLAVQLRAHEKAEQAKKLEEVKEEQKQEVKPSAKKAVVSVSKVKAPASKKRINRPQMARVLPKPQDKKKKSAAAKEPEVKPEEAKHAEEVEKVEPKVESEFVEVEGRRLAEIKAKIEKETLAYLTKELAPAPESNKNNRLSALAMFFDLDLDVSDFHLMVTKIFKKVKRQIEKILDLDTPDAPIHKNLDMDKLKLGTPEEQVARDIKNRILLLFEINTSVNFLGEVTKIDRLNKINTFWRSKRMATILEELEEDQQSQQQILTELSEGLEADAEKLDSDSDEILQPIEPKRAYSVPTTTKLKPFNSIGAPGAQNEKAIEQRKQSMDYSDWVESYRKWRLWNKKGEDEPELLSPFGSPLLSVVSFVKCAKIQDPQVLRTIMIEQQQLALFRLYGMQMQEKLFNLFGASPFGRYVWGLQSSTLGESTLNSVETCGERLTKQLNISSRALVQMLMDQFVETVRVFCHHENERMKLIKDFKKLKLEEKDAAKLMKAKEETQRNVEESVIVEDLKKIMLLLNDIRVLMNNIYTREHVLESLRQDSTLSTHDSLGIDKIQAFLKSVVHFLMIISNSSSRQSNGKPFSSIAKLKVNIVNVIRLVLNLFISQDKTIIRQTETQRILQEMLLDITVDQLESRCYKVHNGVVESRLDTGHSQQIQLLKLLCEVIKISNDTQSALQADQKESGTEGEEASPVQPSVEKTYFLSAGSSKVVRCASLLAFMLHNVEVPAVMRLTIKCASLLFKLLDLRKLKVQDAKSAESPLETYIKESVKNQFLVETLRTIGCKIANVHLTDKQPKQEAKGHNDDDTEARKDELQAKDDEPEIVQEVKKDVPQYYVLCNMNTPEQEDFIFILTALSHWYLRYPNKSLKLIVDPSEICQVPKPNQPESKKEPSKAAEVKEVKEVKDEGKLPDIVQIKVNDVAKSLQQMFSDKKDELNLSSEEAAKLKEHEEVLLAEIQAIEEESKIVEIGVNLLGSEMDQEKLIIDRDEQMLELAKKLSLEEAEIVQKNEGDSDKKLSPEVENMLVIEEAKHEAEVEKPEEMPKEEQKVSKEPKAEVPDKKNPDIRPLEVLEALLPEIQTIQKAVRKWLTHRKVQKQFKISAEQQNEMRMARIIKMIESIREIRNSIQLQKELESQKKELKKVQAQNEARLASEKLNEKAKQLKQPVPGPIVKDGLKSKFENIGGGLPEMPQIKLASLIQAVDAIIKETYKDPFTTDSDEEKRRCVEEKNFYIRLQAILKETLQLAEQLFVRNTAIFEGPFSVEQASELADLLQQAYRGQLTPVNCNPHMKEDMASKLINLVSTSDVKKSAKDLFPITAAKLDEIRKPKVQAETAVPEIIKVTQKNFVVTLIEHNIAHHFVQEVQMRLNETRSQHRQARPGLPVGGSISLVLQTALAQGASQSVIIQELVQLIRGMLQLSDNSEVSAEIQTEFVQLFNFTAKQLSTRSWDYEFSDEERYIITGLLYVFSGWQPQIKTGQLIQINQNNTWINATVVDEGAGKDKISVILDDDDSMQITKISKEKARPINRFELDLEGDLGSKIDQKSLIEAVIRLYQQSRNNDEIVAERQIEYATNSATCFSKSILSVHNILLQMLRTCQQLKWTLLSKEDARFSEFIQIMINISSGKESSSPDDTDLKEFEEDKLMAHWERSLIQSWERLIDKSEKKNLAMFAPREFVYPENALKRQSTSVMQKSGIYAAKTDVKETGSKLINEATFSPQQFTQAQNTFLTGLPTIPQKDNYLLQNLKRLQYWERHVVPHLIKFCTGYYKPYEWKYNFAQLRSHLSLGQIEGAHNDAHEMFGKNPPPGNCYIPDVDFDWSPRIIDECISDEWAIAKIAPSNAKSSSKQQSKGQQGSTSVKSSIALIEKLLQLEIDEILVQIKAVDGKSNSVYVQYFDSDNMTTSFLWLPINTLSELSKPLARRSIGYSNRKLAEDFENSIQKTSQIYSRQTLIKLFQDFQQSFPASIVNLPTQNLHLQDLICWSVWETYCNQPVDGWLKQVSPVIMLDSIKDHKSSHYTFKTIVEETLDKIAEDEIKKSTAKVSKKEGLRSTESTLTLVRDILSGIAAKQTDEDKPDSLINELVDWCVTNWYAISGSIGKSRAVVEISEEYRKYKASQPSTNTAFSNSLPLHNLVPGKGANAVATLILFKKNKVKLTPGSKLMLYSDAEQTDLLQEISSQGIEQQSLDPFVIAKGKVWIEFEEGSNCLVPVDCRNDERSAVECALFHIPKEWSVVCWLTEVLTTILVRSAMKKAPNYVISVFSKLLSAIQVFYEESSAPFYLKTIILRLMSRLIIKLRIVYIQVEKHKKKENSKVSITGSDHFKRLFVSSDFIQTLLSELLVQMDTSACNALSSGQAEKPVPEGLSQVLDFQNKDKVLHPHFAQEAIEFLMHFFIPTSRKLQIDSYKDLLSNKNDSQDKAFSMPLWIEPLLKMSSFLHYLRRQAALPSDLQKRVFNQTRLTSANLDNVVMLLGLPADDPVYTQKWIHNRIFELLKKHKARVLEPFFDVTFVADGDKKFNAVIVLDGFSHMRLLDDGESENSEEMQKKHKIELLFNDSDEEEAKGEDASQKEADKAKRLEEERPKEWTCGACTVINNISVKECECCTSPRPPMDEIIADHMSKLNEERQKKGESDGQVVEQEPLHMKRLKMLQSDLRHMISHDQRIKLLAAIEERKKQEKLEAAQKAEEEAKNAKEQEKVDVVVNQKSVEPKEVEKPVEEPNLQKEEKKEPPQRRNSFASGDSKESKDSNWEDCESGEEEKDIDLENLPEDRYERFRVLGVDTSVLDNEDNDMADLLEMSMIEEIQKKQSDRKAEREAKKKAAEEEKKRKEREEQKKALASSDQGSTFIKIETLVGQKDVFTHEKACIVAQDVLRSRLAERKHITEVDLSNFHSECVSAANFKFSSKVVEIIKQIHHNFRSLPLEELEWPENEPLLTDFDMTKNTLKEETEFENVLNMFSTLVDADVRLVYKAFESQGYDVHLTKAALPCFNLRSLFAANSCSKELTSLGMQEQVKRLVEMDYCNFSSQEIHLLPSELRLLQKEESLQQELNAFTKMNEAKVKDDEDQIVTEAEPVRQVYPFGYFDDKACESRYQEVYNGLSIAEIRYIWALLKTFNEYYVPAVPIINQLQSFIDVPQHSVPLNIGLYMKDLRDLSLNCVKTNLRFLILDQTSVQVEKTPMLYFDRLRMAEKAESLNNEPVAQLARPTSSVIEDKAETQVSTANRDFMFVKAYEQLREIELAMLRPKKPKGSEPHIAFQIVFSDEHVVGWSGPYKQFFSIISNEVQPNKIESKLDEHQLSLTCACANQRDKEQFGGDKFVLTSSDLTPRKLQYFEFLGILMGVGIRTGVNLVLDLPALTWKLLIGSNPNTEDIFQIEYRFYKKMTHLLNLTEAEFSEENYYWNVTLADGKELDLTTDGTGKEKLVSYAERIDFVRKSIYAKLTESSVQCAAIRRGLVKIIPESILNQISYEEIDSWVCGDKFIDVDLIRRNTKLVGFKPDEQLITDFWEFFESLSQPDRRRFIKFCYAIERLPQTDEDWKRQKLEFSIHELKKAKKSGEQTNADELLPEAQTCFFQFKLPRYTNKERMRKQIVCAFTNDNESMNAEQDPLAREMRREHGGEDRRNSYDDQSEQEE